jgi:hypothetical protein
MPKRPPWPCGGIRYYVSLGQAVTLRGPQSLASIAGLLSARPSCYFCS